MNASLLAALLCCAVSLPVLAADKPPQKWYAPGPDEEMGPGMDGPRNPGVEKEAMEYLSSQVPGIDEELERMRNDKPMAFHQKFKEYMKAYREPALRDRFIQNIKSEFQVRRLVKSLRQAQGAEKEQLKKDLEKALSDEFDLRLAGHEAKLKKMQDDIAELKSRIDKRRASKSQIVKKRLSELSGETETWEW
jgi:hypothetical protein